MSVIISNGVLQSTTWCAGLSPVIGSLVRKKVSVFKHSSWGVVYEFEDHLIHTSNTPPILFRKCKIFWCDGTLDVLEPRQLVVMEE